MKPPALHELDAALGESTQDVREAVSERTRRVLERLLDVARSSALEEMASGLAHELNQPLGAIATYAQAGQRMLDRPQPMVAGAMDVLRQISASALSAGEGIRRIRKLFNRDLPKRQRCSIAKLLTDLQPLLEIMAQRTHHRLELHIPSPLPDVYADELHIQHVLFTLAQNAFDARGAAPEDLAPVKIDVRYDQYSIVITVSDSGPGVPPDAEPHIFRPFFTTKPWGTGLGLASSRAIIESHEGKIGFENLQQGGAKFWFRLPVMVETAE